MALSLDEHKDILSFYKINYNDKTSHQIYKTAEDILANKLCRCIQKVTNSVPKKDKKSPIAICKDSVLGKKGISIKDFKCKKTYTFI